MTSLNSPMFMSRRIDRRRLGSEHQVCRVLETNPVKMRFVASGCPSSLWSTSGYVSPTQHIPTCIFYRAKPSVAFYPCFQDIVHNTLMYLAHSPNVAAVVVENRTAESPVAGVVRDATIEQAASVEGEIAADVGHGSAIRLHGSFNSRAFFSHAVENKTQNRRHEHKRRCLLCQIKHFTKVCGLPPNITKHSKCLGAPQVSPGSSKGKGECECGRWCGKNWPAGGNRKCSLSNDPTENYV